ncbi:sulfohydrolase/Glycosulfatase, Zn-dependent hydrolase [Tritrichomonas foetus]|uniref:Sulfohydrolase/Glycosulfatase, Zn-dependent hydrolase n=1 Tax=Tritrichomonas foetus TaxID=1144522 RepID=A0A1J4JJ15_9EUKA|nr:sulfohydrolase/Glycosulfatase, Zn-dependent hydrolase [Tritrichomonas foetus]|eukprot:OHS99176.1 sulfohydrolase/Glycosulfatase, Zn-dependent hydrolase [Tritrichomonas foetus]
MEVHCLGSGGFHDTETAHTCCFMIPDYGIIFDAGSGFFRAPPLVKTEAINIFISHGHSDHICQISHIGRLMESRICQKIRIFAQPEVLMAINVLINPPVSPFPIVCEAYSLYDGFQIELNDSIDKKPTTVSAFQVEHGKCQCFGFKVVSENHSVVYITDSHTTPQSHFLPWIKDVNMIIHDVYYTSEFEERAQLLGHTTSTGMAEVCKSINFNKKLVIMHLNPNPEYHQQILDDIKKVVQDVVLSKDNEVYTF